MVRVWLWRQRHLPCRSRSPAIATPSRCWHTMACQTYIPTNHSFVSWATWKKYAIAIICHWCLCLHLCGFATLCSKQRFHKRLCYLSTEKQTCLRTCDTQPANGCSVWFQDSCFSRTLQFHKHCVKYFKVVSDNSDNICNIHIACVMTGFIAILTRLLPTVLLGPMATGVLGRAWLLNMISRFVVF